MRAPRSPSPASSPASLALGLALALQAVACRVDHAGLATVAVNEPDGGRSSGAGGTSSVGTGGSNGRGGSGGGAGVSGQGGRPGSGGGNGSGGAVGTGGAGTGGTQGGSGGVVLLDAGAGGGSGGGGGSTGQIDATPGIDAADAGADLAVPIDTRPVPVVGCADGTREGYQNTVTYPDIAACAGGWDAPGLYAASTRAPTCGRRGGNTGPTTITSGSGCTVADLCAEGWHVCESNAEVEARAVDCTGAFTTMTDNGNFFYVTRQRGFGPGMSMCQAANDTGSNNLHGCGVSGVAELTSCAPFRFSWSHTECDANQPWQCGTNPNDVMEGDEVTKLGSGRGGALCCRD